MKKPAAIRVLHTAAECFPLVKTGGLADVVAALPKAQRAAKLDARLLLPGLPAREAVRAVVAAARLGVAQHVVRL